MPSAPPDRLPGTSGDTWLDAPHSAWAVWHLDELAPTQTVGRGTGPVRPLPRASRELPVGDFLVTRGDGSEATVRDLLDATETDAFVVLQDGTLVHEEYAHEGAETGRHAVLSITKTIVGCVVASLAERGDLDLSAPVSAYVPELGRSGYRDATLRNLLDMRSGVRFVEAYSDPSSDVNELDRRLVDIGLHAYLRTLPQERPHGSSFRYRSSETDVLGWVCEAATGTPMATLMSDIVWGRIGAEADAYISCDVKGSAIHDGGFAARARDLARFGQMLLDGGTVPDLGAPEEDPQVVVPARWLRDAWGVDSDIRSAFIESPSELTYRGGWYRNQMWFRPGPYGDVLLCIGIHGQLIHVSRRTRTVCVKLSHWPDPVDLDRSQDTLRLCDTVGGILAARGHHPSTRPGRGLPGVAAGTRRGSSTMQHRSPAPT
ncbi:6-aminohexanoate-dimer hydrolase [Nostocoides japonicum T1-X7]|uniref:6-aminohexanoate-dimer hydrolase n=1 Tax=Nostocoides japonicum T1-X7 TaxID=1194083 RepID=A0A077M3T4_9MICO|nr:serine hydrolase [Tetrasphaera japonica]CCH79677.1 6-aminohexanoate-dimer hydrolase [Tetrasphaera japonica T1-X7]